MANSSVNGYQKQNLNRLMSGIRVYVKNTLQPDLVRVLTSKAQSVVSAIDSGSMIPEYTSNLHDATGIGVYVNGQIMSFLPTKKAQKMTTSGFDGVNHYGINGSEFLKQAISEASGKFAKGIWFVIFSATPYAYHINAHGSPRGRGKDFFKQVTDLTLNEILSGLGPMNATSTPMTI